MSRAHVNPWFALKISGALAYLLAAVGIIVVSLVLAVAQANWGYLSRCGGVIVLLGVLLSFRRQFRLGPQRADEPTESLLINRNQLNMKAIHQDVQRAGDNFAQVSGIFLMVLGTVLASYGDLLLEGLVPFAGK